MSTRGHAKNYDVHPPDAHPAPVGSNGQRRPACLSLQSGVREMPGPGTWKRAESWTLKPRGLGICPLGPVPWDLIFRIHCPVLESFTSW